jgi:hypothetical protein
VRVRVVLGVALLLVAAGLLLDMSGRAPRGAGSDHISPAIFAATVPGGGVVCQAGVPLPSDAARAQILIGTYGHPVPALTLSFLDAGGAPVATGRIPPGGREGTITIPLSHVPGAAASASACLRVGGASSVTLGGEGGPLNPTSETVNGHAQPGRISLLYLRHGSESWWQLLPSLTHRFGLGKASFFGDWTLPVAALLLLGVWVGAIRLLLRELT